MVNAVVPRKAGAGGCCCKFIKPVSSGSDVVIPELFLMSGAIGCTRVAVPIQRLIESSK